MNEYHFPYENTDLTKSELIQQYNKSNRRHLVLET